jgi:hypothetical protein
MIIYNYDYVTKEFIGISDATVNPLSPNDFLIPANATTLEPLAFQEGYANIFNGEAWELVVDNRGTTYWLADKTEHTIQNLGVVVPQGAYLSMEDIPLTFEEESDQLNTDYDINMRDLVRDYTLAIARDGITEQSKVDIIRQKILDLDAAYEQAQLDLITKHFGE